MPDIFDEIAQPKKDIFDEIAQPSDKKQSFLEKANQYGIGAAKTVGEMNKRIMGMAEGLGTIATGAASFIPSMAAGAGEIAKQIMERSSKDIPDYLGTEREAFNPKPIDYKPAIKAQQKVQQALTLQPQTETGQAVAGAVAYPFEKYHEVIRKFAPEGKEAKYQFIGDFALLGLPIIVKGIKSGIKSIPEIENTDFYRRMTIRERGIVPVSPEESAARVSALFDELKAKGMSDAEIVRRGNAFKQEALSRRIKSEPIQSPEVKPEAQVKDVFDEVAQPKAEPSPPPPPPKIISRSIIEGGKIDEGVGYRGVPPGGYHTTIEDYGAEKAGATRWETIDRSKKPLIWESEEAQAIRDKMGYKTDYLAEGEVAPPELNKNLNEEIGKAGYDSIIVKGGEEIGLLNLPDNYFSTKQTYNQVRQNLLHGQHQVVIGNQAGKDIARVVFDEKGQIANEVSPEILTQDLQDYVKGKFNIDLIAPSSEFQLEPTRMPVAKPKAPVQEDSLKGVPSAMPSTAIEAKDVGDPMLAEITQREEAKRQMGIPIEPVIVKPAKAAPKVNPETDSLATYIRKQGGFDYQKEHMKGELDRLSSKEAGTTGLVRRKGGGLTLDQMLKRAIEDGYFNENAGVNDLINALENEVHMKKKHYSTQKVWTDKELGEMMKRGEFADTGGYAKKPPSESYAEKEPYILSAPEIVELAREVSAGKMPQIVNRIRAAGGNALGVFIPNKGLIKLRADIFKDPELAKRVITHEIGHLVDFLPDMAKRGNILGRIASLKNYLKNYLGEYEGASGVLTEADKSRLMKEAKTAIKEEKEVGVQPIAEIKLTPDDIKSIWTDIDARLKNKPEGLYNFVSSLSGAEKKQILIEAMRGLVSEKTQKDYRKSMPLAERPYRDWEQKIRDKYQDLIQQEISKRRLFKKDEIMRELKALTQTWKPFDVDANIAFTKYRHSSKELYADSFSVLLNDPALLKEKAPTFYKAFFNWFEKKPEVKQLYDSIIKRTPEQRQAKVEADIGEMFEKGEKAVAKNIEPQEGIVERAREAKAGLKKELVDRFSHLYDSIENPVKRKEVKMAIENVIYSEAQTEGFLIEVKHILDSAKDAGEIDINKYALLRRASTERATMANPVVGTGEAAATVLEGFRKRIGGEKFSQIEQVVKDYFELRKKYVFPRLKEAGDIPLELLEKIENNPNYFTFDVIKYIEKRYGKGVSNLIHEQIGTLQDIAKPFTATILKDIALMKNAEKSIAIKKSIKELSAEGLASPAEKKFDGFRMSPAEPKNPDLGLVKYLDKGKLEGVYVPKDIAEMFKRNPVEGWVITKFFRTTAQPFRELFVHKRQGFALFNIVRDVMSAVQSTKGMTLTNFLPTWFKSLPEAHKRTMEQYSPDVLELLQGKALIPSVDYTAGNLKEATQFERLLIKHGIMDAPQKNKVFKSYDKLVSWLNYLSETSESTTKIALYKWLEKNTDLPKEDIMYIVRWTGSPAFLVKGEATPLVNNILLFSNPAIQGWRWQVEAARANPKEFAWKYAKYIVLPSILKYAAVAGLLGAAMEELMKRVSRYDAMNYHIIPLGETDDGKTVYLRMPMSEVHRFGNGLMWAGLTKIKKPSDLLSLFDYTFNQVPGLSPAISIPRDIIAFMAGQNVKDSFRGTWAIPEKVMQAKDERTIKAIGKYLANQAGIGIVYKFDTSDPDRIKTQLEKILGYPIASDIIGRFIKISDAGVRQELRDVTDIVKTSEARKGLDIKERIMESINAATKEGRKATMKEAAVLYKNLLAEKVIEPSKSFSQFYNTYGRYSMKPENNAYIDAVISANTNEQKAALLRRYEDTMNKDKYNEILKQLLVEGQIGREVLYKAKTRR